MLSYVLLRVFRHPQQRLEPPFSERVDLTSDSLGVVNAGAAVIGDATSAAIATMRNVALHGVA